MAIMQAYASHPYNELTHAKAGVTSETCCPCTADGELAASAWRGIHGCIAGKAKEQAPVVLTTCMRDTMQRMIAALPLPVHPSPGENLAFGKPHYLFLFGEISTCRIIGTAAPLPCTHCKCEHACSVLL